MGSAKATEGPPVISSSLLYLLTPLIYFNQGSPSMHLLSPPPSDQTGSAGKFLSQGLNHSAGRGVRAAGGVIKASQTGCVLGPAVEVPSRPRAQRPGRRSSALSGAAVQRPRRGWETPTALVTRLLGMLCDLALALQRAPGALESCGPCCSQGELPFLWIKLCPGFAHRNCPDGVCVGSLLPLP